VDLRRGGDVENSLPLPGIDTGRPARSLVTILTELFPVSSTDEWQAQFGIFKTLHK
jgi:hypothetical protein